MKSRILALLRDEFVRHNAVFFVGSMMVAFLNYLYHPIMSRMMSVEAFGEVQVLFSLLAQLSIPLGIFSMIALNLYANDHDHTSPSVRQFSLLTTYIGSLLALVLLCTAPYLTRTFKLTSLWGVVIIAATLFISALTVFGKSYLQASRRFTQASNAAAIGAGGKLLAAMALVALGYATLGALGGFLLASIATFIYVYAKTGAYTALPCFIQIRRTPELTRELHYGVLILFATGLLTFFSTADITFAKYLFPADTAGLYSGISIIARIIFFATGSIGGVLLAHVKLSETNTRNKRVLKKALFLTMLVGGTGFILLALFPTPIIMLMVGSHYAPLAALLPTLALHTLALALIGVFVNYALALRRKSVIIISTIGVVSTLVFLVYKHSEPADIVYAFLGGSIITLIACTLTYARPATNALGTRHETSLHQVTTTRDTGHDSTEVH